MIIKNGLVFHDDKTFRNTDIYIAKGRICAMLPTGSDVPATYAEDEIIDAQGCYVLPGLIDIHSHGAVGHDFSDGNADGLREILAYEYAHGISSSVRTKQATGSSSGFTSNGLNPSKQATAPIHVSSPSMRIR